ncbi:MAG: S24/S26 family peptidase [Methanobacterium sp.]|nr:S24/S26 family peptidase [Methanobacterium sp.]
MYEFLNMLLKMLPIIIIVAIITSQVVAVPTDSMAPVINSGDMVLVQKTDLLGIYSELNPEEVKEGDIVIYSKGSESEEHGNTDSQESVIHRVVSVYELDGSKYFILKGDNNLDVDDERVYPHQISAKAVMWGGNPIIIPQIGNIIIFFKSLIHDFTSAFHGGG